MDNGEGTRLESCEQQTADSASMHTAFCTVSASILTQRVHVFRCNATHSGSSAIVICHGRPLAFAASHGKSSSGVPGCASVRHGRRQNQHARKRETPSAWWVRHGGTVPGTHTNPIVTSRSSFLEGAQARAVTIPGISKHMTRGITAEPRKDSRIPIIMVVLNKHQWIGCCSAPGTVAAGSLDILRASLRGIRWLV
jgi:hypothetical protein